LLDGSYRIDRVIGSGGFGITYEAEDVKLKTTVAIKEYCPEEFGYRDASLSVRPKSERQTKTFEWGRSSFLQEAQTLARFRHPSVVQVTRVFEAYSTAYMVMIFERGQSFEKWLKRLERLPTQEELDKIAGPLLGALEMMHAESFLHRDIAPDNIIVRADGTPVLLDFGAARRAVAEESRSLTGIVKAGYSPQEQYAADGRLQGPWTDIYAFGATLYRAVSGKVPEESTLRAIDDHLLPAVSVGGGRYRSGFLLAIDACLQVHHSARPQSVAQLRPLLFAPAPRSTAPPIDTRKMEATEPTRVPQARGSSKPWWAVAAMLVVAGGGAFGGLQYARWQADERGGIELDSKRKADQELQRQADAAAAIKRADEEAQTRARAETGAKHRAEESEAKRLVDAEVVKKKAEEERARKVTEAKLKAEEEAKRQADADAAARKAEEARLARVRAVAEAKREEELRMSAAEEVRRKEEEARRNAEVAAEEKRLAAIADGDMRVEFVRKVQLVLKRTGCYDGALTGRSDDAQEGLNKLVDNANTRGKFKLARIQLAKASVADFEAWLKDADAVKGELCVPKTVKPAKQEPAKTARQRDEDTPASRAQAAPKNRGESASNQRPGHGGSCTGWMWYNSSCVDGAGRRCTQTQGGRKCD
jgi:hypothetical protein